MKQLAQHIYDAAGERIKNVLIGNFIISWIIVNHQIIFYLLLSEDSRNSKLSYMAGLKFDFLTDLMLPLLITVAYIYLIPIINILLNSVKIKFIEPLIAKQNNNKEMIDLDSRLEVLDKRLDLKFRERDRDIETENEKLEAQQAINNKKAEELEIQEKISREKAKSLADEQEKEQSLANALALQENKIKRFEKRRQDILIERDAIKSSRIINELAEENGRLHKEIENLNNKLNTIRAKSKGEEIYSADFIDEVLRKGKK